MTSCLNPLRLMAQVLTLCALSTTAFAAPQPIFPALTYESYAVASPLAMADADLNGDGIADTLYAAASTTAGSTALTAALRSASTGASPTLVPANTISCTANSIALADLNKDSKLDAVVTCNENTVAVLAGNGDGTFAAPTTYTVNSPAKVIAADLDGDGFPDLVVATDTNSTSSDFAVLKNAGGSGALTFAAAKTYSGGTLGSAQIMVADVNYDGKLDVIAGGRPEVYQGYPAGVFFGNGDGTFQPMGNLSGLRKITAIADFDGDGLADIAGVFDNSGYALSTSLSVTYANVHKIGLLINLPLPLVSIQPIDLNGDGYTDLVLAGSTTTVLLNDRAGGLTIARSYDTPGDFYISRRGSLGNDLVFSTPRGFYTLHNDGKGGFDGLPSFYFSDIAAVADLNADGLADMVATRSDLFRAYSISSQGNGGFIQYQTASIDPKSFLVLGDFDGDTITDLVTIFPSTAGGLGQLQSTMAFLKGSAGGSFTPGSNFIGLGIQGAKAAVTADFDGDKNLDLVISYLDTTPGATNVSGLILVRSTGNGGFAFPLPSIASSTTAISDHPLVADLNRDGKPDIVWGGSTYLNQGANSFTPLALPAQGAPLAIGDLNGDSFPDLVLDNAIYAGKGDGTFLATPIFTIGIPADKLISVSIGDLNGDGNADLIAQSFYDMAGFTVIFGDGHGGFTVDPNTYTTGRNAPVSGVLARLNGSAPALPADGRLDYIVFGQGAAVSLLNQTNPAPPPPSLFKSVVSLTSRDPSVYPNQSAVLSAVVSGINPTGTLTFTTADVTVISKVTLNGNTATILASFPTEGNYAITATYSGDGNNAPATSASILLPVHKYPTTVSFYYEGHNYAGSTVTLHSYLNGYGPTGQVTFTSGSTTLGTATLSNGSATLPYVFPTPGTYPVTISYSGDAANAPTSSTTSLTIVVAPDFSLSATPAINTVTAGATATWTVTITSLNNYTGTVLMGCQQDNCGTAQVVVTPSQPGQVRVTIQTKAPSNTLQPTMRYTPIAAAALLLAGVRRRYWRKSAARLHLGMFATILFLGLVSISGCSSGSSSATNTGTSSTIVLVGSDSSIPQSHTVTLTLVVK